MMDRLDLVWYVACFLLGFSATSMHEFVFCIGLVAIACVLRFERQNDER